MAVRLWMLQRLAEGGLLTVHIMITGHLGYIGTVMTPMVLKAGHTFNLLDARGAISVTERAAYIGRIRTLSRAIAQSYYESRERLGFPMLDAPAKREAA